MFGLRDREVLVLGGGQPGGDGTPEGALPYRRLLARQLGAHCRFRFGVTVLIVLGTVFAGEVVGVHGLPVVALVSMAAAVAVFNLGVWAAVHQVPKRVPTERAGTWLLSLRHATIVADYLALTVLIHLVGGARSPFLAAFLLHIVLGSMMVSRAAAYTYSGLAILLVNAIVFGELAGLWVPVLPVGAVASDAALDPRFAVSVAAAYTFLFGVTTALLTTLADAMRRLERELVETNAELSNLSAARRDFLHVALHNLKSPLAATSMLLNNLGAELAGPLAPSQRDLVERARRRLAESERFIRDLDLLASLEARELAVLDDRVDVSALMLRIVDEHREHAEVREQRLELEVELDRTPIWARGHDRLLHEAVVNLVTNALKFTPRGGVIRLSLAAEAGSARIAVADQGPGIPPEQRSRLFREFARLGTVLPDGERPPGSGLGLSIVRRIAQALGGGVRVESAVGTGSTFILEIPLAAPRSTPPVPTDAPRPIAPTSRSSPPPAVRLVPSPPGAR